MFFIFKYANYFSNKQSSQDYSHLNSIFQSVVPTTINNNKKKINHFMIKDKMICQDAIFNQVHKYG